MDDVLNIGDWIVETYPECFISEEVYDNMPDRHSPGKAWVHFYSVKKDMSFVLSYDDYEKAKNKYDEYVECENRRIELNKKRMLFK